MLWREPDIFHWQNATVERVCSSGLRSEGTWEPFGLLFCKLETELWIEWRAISGGVTWALWLVEDRRQTTELKSKSRGLPAILESDMFYPCILLISPLWYHASQQSYLYRFRIWTGQMQDAVDNLRFDVQPRPLFFDTQSINVQWQSSLASFALAAWLLVMGIIFFSSWCFYLDEQVASSRLYAPCVASCETCKATSHW